jgi:hypothetical protein
MTGLWFLFRRKRETATEKTAVKPSPAVPAQRQERPWHFMGSVPERTQDLLGRQDGERVGFRKPVRG